MGRLWSNVIVGESRIKMLFLAAGDAEHEKNDAAEHREDDSQQEKDRPSGSIPTRFDHGDAAGRTSKNFRDEVHGAE